MSLCPDARVQVAINGTAQGTGCQVQSPGSNNGASTDTSCGVTFGSGEKIAPITTTGHVDQSNCAVTMWVRYD